MIKPLNCLNIQACSQGLIHFYHWNLAEKCWTRVTFVSIELCFQSFKTLSANTIQANLPKLPSMIQNNTQQANLNLKDNINVTVNGWGEISGGVELCELKIERMRILQWVQPKEVRLITKWWRIHYGPHWNQQCNNKSLYIQKMQWRPMHKSDDVDRNGACNGVWKYILPVFYYFLPYSCMLNTSIIHVMMGILSLPEVYLCRVLCFTHWKSHHCWIVEQRPTFCPIFARLAVQTENWMELDGEEQFLPVQSCLVFSSAWRSSVQFSVLKKIWRTGLNFGNTKFTNPVWVE